MCAIRDGDVGEIIASMLSLSGLCPSCYVDVFKINLESFYDESSFIPFCLLWLYVDLTNHASAYAIIKPPTVGWGEVYCCGEVCFYN